MYVPREVFNDHVLNMNIGNFVSVFSYIEIMFVFFVFLHVEFSDEALYLDIKTSAF